MRTTVAGSARAQMSMSFCLLFIPALLLTACGGSAEDVGTGEERGQALTDVRFRLSWVMGGEHSPYLLGIEKGFFRDEGLAVQLQQGNGSSVSVQLVGNDTVDFAVADTQSLVAGAEEGLPVKMVFNSTPSSGFILNWVRGRIPDLESPKDLEGLTVGSHQGSTESAVLPFFLDSNNVDRSEVNSVQGPPPTSMYTALIEGRINVRMGLIRSLTAIEELEPSLEFGYIDLVDWGLELQAHGVIVNERLIDDSREVVAAFVRGAQRSWQYVLENEANQEEAFELMLELYPEILEEEGENEESQRNSLSLEVNNLASGSTEDKPLGYMPSDRWESTLRTLAGAFEGERELTLETKDYYTNEFLSDDYRIP